MSALETGVSKEADSMQGMSFDRIQMKREVGPLRNKIV